MKPVLHYVIQIFHKAFKPVCTWDSSQNDTRTVFPQLCRNPFHRGGLLYKRKILNTLFSHSPLIFRTSWEGRQIVSSSKWETINQMCCRLPNHRAVAGLTDFHVSSGPFDILGHHLTFYTTICVWSKVQSSVEEKNRILF